MNRLKFLQCFQMATVQAVELLAEGYFKPIPRETTTDLLINRNSWNSLHLMLFEVKDLRRISMEGNISRKTFFGMTTLCVSDHG